MRFHNTWKYTTIGLLALIVVGLSLPQASAHITTKSQHLLEHLYAFTDGIEAKTDNLPSDPADQSLIDAQLESIQSDTDNIQASIDGLSGGGGATPKSVDIFLSAPTDPPGPFNTELLPYAPGKTYSGHISGHLSVGASNVVEISCAIGGEHQRISIVSVDRQGLTGTEVPFSEDFACDDLVLAMDDIDIRTGTASTLIATIQYMESTDVTERTS
jgi:hypothetical protein